MAKEVFKAKVVQENGLTMKCTARGHEITLDEPKELGGNDIGMNPVEALLSALGACKAIVIQSFGQMKGMKINNFEIEVEGDLDPDGFMGKNPDAKIGFTEVRTTITIDADNSDEEIEEFIEFVENTCPVQDTLTNPANYKAKINK